MSDNLRVQINIEIYDQCRLLNDFRGELLKQHLIEVCSSKLTDENLKGDFFISASVF